MHICKYGEGNNTLHTHPTNISSEGTRGWKWHERKAAYLL